MLLAAVAMTSFACGDATDSVDGAEPVGTVQEPLNGNLFSSWAAIGSGTFNSAFAITARGVNSLDVFGRGMDNKFYTNVWSNTGGWGSWNAVGSGTFTSKPASTRWRPAGGNYQLALVGKGGDNTIFINVTSGANLAWQGWQQVKTTTFNSAPAVAFDGTSIYLIARRSDSALYWTKNNVSTGYNQANWLSWSAIPGGTVSSEPAAVSTNGGSVTVAVKGTNDAYWRTSVTGSTWTGYTEIPGGTFKSAPALSTWNNGAVDIFGRGFDDRLYFASSSNGTTWGAYALKGGTISSAPAAWAWGTGHVDVVVQGSDSRAYITTYQE